MCVRTLAGGEINDGSLRHKSDQQTRSLISSKEKPTESHDEMVKEAQVKTTSAAEQITSARTFLPNLIGNVLSPSALSCGTLVDATTRYRQRLRRSRLFKILFHTTQPAHVVMIAAVLCVTSALLPTDKIQPVGQLRAVHASYTKITSFVYLASFVIHFGAQIWMTFVSGLSLYFALPRHTFGEVQRVLFPRYFTINACLSLITLLIFIKHHPAHTWDTEIAIQVGGMSGAFFVELLIRLYLTPPLLKLIVKKNTLERAAGIGSEIGRLNAGPLKHCPHYLRIHNAFRRVHVSIAMGNMLSMACTVLHLQYIASKLCVL